MVRIGDYIAAFASCFPEATVDLAPWQMTEAAGRVTDGLMGQLSPDSYIISDKIAIHRSARIESGAQLKGPLIIGPECFVAAGALLRGGVWLERACSIGPGCEVKSSVLFAGARLAHFNFIGDSVIGADVNFEAGSIVANTRNERAGSVRVRIDGMLHDTGAAKFGALVGDGARIGANAVLAPGTLLAPGAIVPRLGLVDQETQAGDHSPA